MKWLDQDFIGLGRGWTKWITSMKIIEDDLNKKISLLSRLIVAFRDQIHTDIQLKPGNNRPCIPVHRALLAARSEIFRNMLDSDGCKAPPNDTITLPELNTDELESLLEFLYSGNVPLDKLEKHVYSLFVAADKISSRVTTTTVNEPQPHANQLMIDLKDKRIKFLSGLYGAFKEEIHTDTQLKPGDDGPCIPAHGVILATRSEIFKNMLDSDGIKAPPSDTITITLPELNYEELESLLEFLYCGSLPLEKLEKHVYPLFIAAEKYEISYLQEFCQCYMLNSLNGSSVLDVLETSEVCSNKGLKEIALNFIFSNTEAVVLSDKYEALAAKNPQLCMQITREFFTNVRNEKVSRVRMGFQKKMGFQEKSSKELQTKAGEGKLENNQEFEESRL
ncbi:hypothetical protein CRYUN_Cryun41cG0069900 [Craigia yunnanensis]